MKANIVAKIFCVFFLTLLKVDIIAFESLKVGFNTQKLDGFSTYTIGGITDTESNQIIFHFPISELKFPLNIYTGNLNVESAITNRWTWHLSVVKNFNNAAGKLKDSDWLTPTSTQKDIYSESDVQLNALGIDTKISYLIRKVHYSKNQSTCYLLGVGYKYQDYAFKAYDLKQWYPNEPEKDPVIQSGKVLTYTINSKIPYWEFEIRHQIKNTFGSISLGYSPYLKLLDRDDHILRSKLAEGDLLGQMRFLILNLRYYFNPQISGFLGYKHQIIQSRGKQKQSRYQDTTEGNAGHIADLDQKIDSELSSLTFGFAYQFSGLKNESEKLNATSIKPKPALQPSIGLSYLYPISERESSIGLHIELETDYMIFGASYHKGNNKVKTFSKGLYTILPVYGIFKISTSKNLSLQIGGGYSFNKNEIDPHVVSHLTTLGFPSSKEILSSAWMGILGLEYSLPSRFGAIKYRFQYSYQKPNLHSKSDEHDTTTSVEISQLSLGIQVNF